MADLTTEPSNLFSFMVIRDPSAIADATLRQGYIQDDEIGPSGRVPIDIFSRATPSAIGHLVYEQVFCPPPPSTEPRSTGEPATPGTRTLNAQVVESAIALLPRYYAPCDDRDPPADADPIALERLVGRHYFERDDRICLIPDRLADLKHPWMERLATLLGWCRAARTNAEVEALPARAAALFGAQDLWTLVFYKGQYHPQFQDARRALFDRLYLLYLLRRGFELSLEQVIDGLRCLHVLEALATDEYLDAVRGHGGPLANDGGLLGTLRAMYPELRDWDLRSACPKRPWAATRAGLARLLEAVVVVHPLFARLHNFRTPFNAIRPIGIGDLKVVKQTALEYVVGDISHIDNVLEGETKTRTHRRLEKAEDSFSFSSEDVSESQRDVQSTDRFELRKEAEATISSTLAVNANASVTYNGSPVVATVSGGVAYNSASNEVEKISQNFARDVIEKSVKRVQRRVSEQRSSTRLLEVEETNGHSFVNPAGNGHVSGIYRWLERRYRAQTYNFGKRLMFEFVLPEPAAFFAESRLQAYEATLEVPQPPTPPAPAALPADIQALRPEHIDPQRFRELQVRYDLSEFEYPQVTRHVELVNQATGRNAFVEFDMDATNTRWQSRSFDCKLDAVGYRVDRVLINGRLFFWGMDGSASDDPNNPADRNTFIMRVDGYETDPPISWDNSAEFWNLTNVPLTLPRMPALARDTVTMFLGFWDISRFDLSFHAELTLSDEALYAWRTRVHRKVLEVERARANAIDERNQQSYAAEVARYKSRLAEIRAEAISELVRGRSASANRQLVLDELKKLCIGMIAKEFDVDAADDSFSGIEALGSRTVTSVLRPFRIRESATGTTARFERQQVDVLFPSVDIAAARTKGRYVQFLEQAFEWQQLAWIFYPYFWASQPRWVETMAREDDADPQFTAFLRAGSARVLVAVTPAYEDAVMHFIATGEPWDGGPSPAIGDPLFLPIHEELRRQKDDLYGGRPDGAPWEFLVPTSLVYLENSSTPLPGPPSTTPPAP